MCGVETLNSFREVTRASPLGSIFGIKDDEWPNEYEGIVPMEHLVGHTNCKDATVISQKGQTEDSEDK